MPVSLSCDEFLDVVREAGVVDEQALESFLQQWRQGSPESTDAVQLAESMFKAGLITSFQKKSLLQGKRRGYIIADKYILLDHIGAGGMGSVWLCQHKVMRRRVAIKVLPTSFSNDPEYLARFHREARAAATLDHPNIVRAFDVDQDDKMHFLVMEYVDGCSFQDLVDDSGPVDIQQAVNYISQAAAGLQHAHEAGVVHRDIKPGNLLVDRRGAVKILDMGMALFFQEQGKSLTQQYDANAVLGTAEYLAPEQALDSHGVDIRADIYSLGLTFFFLLTGKSPYGEEGTTAQKLLWHQLRTPKSVRELRPEVPEGVAAIIAKMLAKNPAERYQTPDEVAKALAAWVQGMPAPQPGDGQEARDEVRERRKLSATIAKRRLQSGRSSEAETATEAEDEQTRIEARAKKKPKSEPRSPDGKRPSDRNGKHVEEPEDRVKPKRKPESSAKHRRKKSAGSGFWSSPGVILAGAGTVLLVAAGLVSLLVYMLTRARDTDPPVRPTAPVAQAPKQNPLEPDKKPPIQVLEKKAEPVNKEMPPVPEKKEEEPPKKEILPKIEEKTEPVKKNPPPQEEPEPLPPNHREPLAEYFPKPGTTLFYNVANYASQTVTRQKWEYTHKGVIIVSLVQLGAIEKDTLLSDGQVKWLKAVEGKDQLFFRKTKTHFETGHILPQAKTIVWEPTLPLTVGLTDTWKFRLPNGEYKDYAVVKFDTYKGKRAVTIRDSYPSLQGGRIVTHHTYVQGIGEVAKSQSLETTSSAPQLVADAMLVEE